MTTTANSATCDVAVIGAGVFGAWTAYQLRQSGKSVMLIDAYGAGNSRSSSGGESRIIRMGYGRDEVYTRWAKRALNLWQEFFAEIGEPLFQRTGVLWLAQDNDLYPLQCAETLERVGISFEKLAPSELAVCFPQLALDKIAWALFEPHSGALMARRAVQAVTNEAIKKGVSFLQGSVTAPTKPEPGGGGKLDSVTAGTGDRISAGTFVFACGPWFPALFPELLAARIRPTRQEVFFFGIPKGDRSFSAPALPIWLDFKDEAYGFPDLESRGVKIAIDRHGPPFDPETGDRVVSSKGLAEARQYLACRIPALTDAPVTETRVCQYENTSSGDFLIDRHPAFENVWLVGGGSGHGFKHGPVVGEYVATRIDGIREGVEPRFSFATKATTQERAVF